MYLMRRKNVKNIFEYLNERTQTAFNEHDSIIYNEKDSHKIK